jgi:hypothetical protein
MEHATPHSMRLTIVVDSQSHFSFSSFFSHFSYCAKILRAVEKYAAQMAKICRAAYALAPTVQ